MGQGIPKAVTSIVLERNAGSLFQVGLAEMNGWRPSMEDAHVVVMQDSWGFFGVFDGHGGQQCSSFVARRLEEELKDKPLPQDDATVKALMLRIDKEFLDSQQPSGSTATFAFVEPPAADASEKRFRLRVGNIGDSRVLLGRSDGTIVEGPGTDSGLTTDHKPDNEVERERIYRTGGTVETIQGVARVNGDLAVSRAFGDAPHKQTGGPKQEDHPVSVEPEFTTFSCEPSDFLMLVCDGISESNFSNAEVVQLAAERLQKCEPAHAAAAVCRRALERGSMDNLSCMIVLFKGGDASEHGPKKELLPGPFSLPCHGGFRQAYAAMADRAGMSLEAAVEKRYDSARKERVEAITQRTKTDAKEDNEEQVDGEDVGTALAELREELAHFQGGPSKSLEEGSPVRTGWFKGWLDAMEVEPVLDLQNMSRDQMLDLLERDPGMLAMAQAQGIVSQNSMRMVRVAAKSELQPAVEAHPALKWDPQLSALCGELGRVLDDDQSDGTSQVRFRGRQIAATVWLPSSCLSDADEVQTVRVDSEEKLREAVDAHEQLTWEDEMSKVSGQLGIVSADNSMLGLSEVEFAPPLSMKVWLPKSVLAEVEEDDSDESFDECEGDEDPPYGLLGEESEDEDSDDEPRSTVVVAAVDKLKPAIEASASLKWEDNIAKFCGQQGELLRDDEEDGTSCVRFPGRVIKWFPTCVLEVISKAADAPVENEDSSSKVDSSEPVAEGETDDGNGNPKRQRTC